VRLGAPIIFCLVPVRCGARAKQIFLVRCGAVRKQKTFSWCAPVRTALVLAPHRCAPKISNPAHNCVIFQNKTKSFFKQLHVPVTLKAR